MKKVIIILVCFLFLLLFIFTGCMDSEPFNYEFDLEPDSTININYQMNNEIKVQSGEVNKLILKGLKITDPETNSEEVEIIAKQNNNIININLPSTHKGEIKDLNIYLPLNFKSFNILSNSKYTHIEDIFGNITITTHDNTIYLSNVYGHLELFNAYDSKSGIYCDYSSEDFIDTVIYSNNNITVLLHDYIDVDFEAKTNYGTISLNNINIFSEKETNKHLTGKIGAGGNNLYIESIKGNIVIEKIDSTL